MTPRQAQLLRYLAKETNARDGISPSMDEMAEYLNLKSKSGVHRILVSLEKLGFIRRVRGRARGVEVIRLPAKAVERSHDPAVIAANIEARFGPIREGVLVVRLAELCDFLTAENLT